MYSSSVILPSATPLSPFSQLAVRAGFSIGFMESATASYTISPIWVGVMTCVFLSRCR